MIELHTSVRVGDFSGFVSDLFLVGATRWARVTNWAEDNSTICPVEFLEAIT